ncbi:hypothetical protein QBC37DRAFT_426577 [Rhypophila decipiens]|uniref:Uncharacterized protein n=1 Tax=Rhypophila decipiens TaxID=261697 RepID=A0AAN6Y5I4_9PEZI|nr:hypothetical protein QBC37DRAFT_426577 [Rhypophila decipiens]
MAPLTKEEDSAMPIPSTPPPKISKNTIHMAGLLVDVYGLDELPPSSACPRISCLWLHHPRTRSKETMGDIAARCVGAWNSGEKGPRRGLIALAFDQRNHGSRLVDSKGNLAWRQGNEMHAQDMYGVISGTVADQGVLLDAVGGYLFHDEQPQRGIDHHLALGVSLGGHSVWQLLFADPRVRAGVAVIGCPDFMYMLSDRAKKSKLPTFSAQDNGSTFLGSKDFPPSLVNACRKQDPRGILFGTSEVTTETFTKKQHDVLHEKLAGKKILVCSGGSDKLVPYSCSEPFLRWLKEATTARFKEEKIEVDDRVYEGIGHQFSEEMVADAVRFVVDVVGGADADNVPGKDEVRSSKI